MEILRESARSSSIDVDGPGVPVPVLTLGVEGDPVAVRRPVGPGLLDPGSVGELDGIGPVCRRQPDLVSLAATSGLPGEPVAVGRKVRTVVSCRRGSHDLGRAPRLKPVDVVVVHGPHEHEAVARAGDCRQISAGPCDLDSLGRMVSGDSDAPQAAADSVGVDHRPPVARPGQPAHPEDLPRQTSGIALRRVVGAQLDDVEMACEVRAARCVGHVVPVG